MKTVSYLMLAVAIVTGAIGQIFLKLGADKAAGDGLRYYFNMILCPYILVAILLYGASFALWMRALKFFDVSYARPLTSIGYVLTYILAILFLGEELTARRIAGVVIITIGVILIK